MAYSLKCPLCGGKFRWNPVAGFPDKCELCHQHIGHDRADDDIVIPAFLSPKTKATDKIYTDMARGSEVRAEKAAEMAGCAPSDMAGLKITDFNDRRDAEIAHVGDGGALERLKASTPAPVGFQGNGAEFAAGIATGNVVVNGQITTGIEPRAGARAVQNVQRLMGR